MKTKLLLAIILMVGLSAKGQTIDKTMYDNVYYFVTSATLQECSGNGSDSSASHDIDPGTKFKITKILSTGDYVIHILEAKDTNRVVKNVRIFNHSLVFKVTDHNDATGNKEGGASPVSFKYLKLPDMVFNSSCEIVLKKYSVALGVLTIPIKLRPGQKFSNGTYRDFAFESDISLGLSVGFKYAPNKHTAYNFLTGIDLTSVPVTPESTNNAVRTSTNLSAITWHFGVLFQIDNFQVGAFTGIDYLAGNTGRQWMYRNDMWLGFGIGYSIFSPKSTTDTQ